MDAVKFLSWAESARVENGLAQQIANHAPIDEEYNDLYCLKNIARSYVEPPFSIQNPTKSGFWVVGSCCNGDQIVVNVSDDFGGVYYLNHEGGHAPPYKLAKVAKDLDGFMELRKSDQDPIDYYAALKLSKS